MIGTNGNLATQLEVPTYNPVVLNNMNAEWHEFIGEYGKETGGKLEYLPIEETALNSSETKWAYLVRFLITYPNLVKSELHLYFNEVDRTAEVKTAHIEGSPLKSFEDMIDDDWAEAVCRSLFV